MKAYIGITDGDWFEMLAGIADIDEVSFWLALWEALQERLHSPVRPAIDGVAEEAPRFGKPILVMPRRGQGTFKIMVTDAYERRCAVTRERTLPVLEAGHIIPYSEGGTHDVRNGLLLRRDLHTLFDRGYVTVTPEYNLEVSKRIREEFENGRDYHPGRFAVLHSDREEIEKDCGFELEWDEKPGNKYSSIRARKDGDSQDRDAWPELHDWVIDTMVTFNRVFRPLLQTID